MSLTPSQNIAVRERGNVLVIAGAGTGKTRTLVERCLHCLLHDEPAVSIDQILMVTFTEAAAAEMRARIRMKLEEQTAAAPEEVRWKEQLALFDTAHIGTLHSFCLKLVREHFYELELDPQLSVITDEDARLLANETLEAMLERYYSDESDFGEKVRSLVQDQGSGSDKNIRRLVMMLHRYAQSLPDSRAWIERQIALFEKETATFWQSLLEPAFVQWATLWLPFLKEAGEADGNSAAAICFEAIQKCANRFERHHALEAVKCVIGSLDACPRGRKTEWQKQLKPVISGAEFLHDLLVVDESDPLQEDWDWTRHHLRALLQLAREFTRCFAEAKRELGVADFQDLEQHALALLWDHSREEPTAVARQWRERLRLIFVDEYQDINAAQDRIIQALGGEGADANRFLVGDVKQSIYRFRLANPYIFQGYATSWAAGSGAVVALQDNFRSQKGILDFANSVFGMLMRPEFGGVSYDASARLVPGQPCKFAGPGQGKRVEIHLRLKDKASRELDEEEAGRGSPPLPDPLDADEEAALVGQRFLDLHRRAYAVWDSAQDEFRPVRWADMAILLRSPAGKSESYAKEFARLGIPLVVERGGFYQSIEITDLLSILQLLDNPLQDIPLVGALSSPLGCVTPSELAVIRLSARKTRFWSALLRWHECEARTRRNERGQAPPSDTDGLFAKVDLFLTRFRRWRKLARQVSLSRCLEAVLADTHYEAWLSTQTRGELRRGNVRRLLGLAQHFDHFQKQGLFRFLRFIEAQQESQAEPAAASSSTGDAVRLMSIHQSKGLEFPVVALPDLAKPFNESDLRAPVILDEEYGLCSQVKRPGTGSTYPALTYWLAQQRQKRELVGEEMRLLYVAVTRARDLLLMFGGVTRARLDKLPDTAPGECSTARLLRTRSYLDWLLMWAGANLQLEPGASAGESELAAWFIHAPLGQGRASSNAENVSRQNAPEAPELLRLVELQKLLVTGYPHLAATTRPAKTTVTSVRRSAAADFDEHSSARWVRAVSPLKKSRPARVGKLSAADVGSAYHKFLQLVELDKVSSLDHLREEAHRLVKAWKLTREESAALDLDAILSFWQSPLGAGVLANPGLVKRELAFTLKMTAAEVDAFSGDLTDGASADEQLILQGVADLVVLGPAQAVVVDFKTDDITAAEVSERTKLYAPQLRLYAEALARIYKRPVAGCWLYFLTVRKAVEIEVPPTAAVLARRNRSLAKPAPIGK